MEQTLLSRKDLAKRWGVSTSTIDRRVRENLISPVDGYKTPQFNLFDVLKVEGTDTSKMSPFERKRLERDIEKLEEENSRLKEEKERLRRQLTNVVAGIMPVLTEIER